MAIVKNKIAIIGAGYVGSSFAYALMISGAVNEIVIIDRDEDRAEGEAMDLNHGVSFTDPITIYSAGYEGCRDADIVVITAGAGQVQGETRLDLAGRNAEIYRSIIRSIKTYIEHSIILVVTNPVDVLTCLALVESGLPKNRVIGSGTVLDSSRFRYLISRHCGIDARNVHAYIVGEHGDTEVPIWSNTNIAGMPIREYCPVCPKPCDSEQELNRIFEEVKNAAYRIIQAKGATNFAIGLSLVRIVKAILRDEHSVLPVSSLVEDYYGISDVCLSLPSIIGRGGVISVLDMTLSERETEDLRVSADTIRQSIEDLDIRR